ncbi:MAG: hypothetical protein WDM88_05000 [Galbitalea sp.]
MTAIRLEIPGLGVTIEPEAGAKIVAIDDEAGSWIANYDWRSPLPATDGASYGDSQADWLSAYRGGLAGAVPQCRLPRAAWTGWSSPSTER